MWQWMLRAELLRGEMRAGVMVEDATDQAPQQRNARACHVQVRVCRSSSARGNELQSQYTGRRSACVRVVRTGNWRRWHGKVGEAGRWGKVGVWWQVLWWWR